LKQKEFKLKYGRWILKKKGKEEPYLSIGRWILLNVEAKEKKVVRS